MEKLKISGINYLNTKPFLWGLVNEKLSFNIDLQLDIPSVCAQNLKNNVADIGLVPVGALHEIPNAKIFSDYCIGCNGFVRTVCLFSDVPINFLTHIYLDYHSRTSVELLKILLKKYWKVSPKLIPASKGFEKLISGPIGGLIIGDRVVEYESRFKFQFDLGKYWNKMTGMPFTFAVWVTNKSLSESHVSEFNRAFYAGVNSIDKLLIILQKPSVNFDLKLYFEKNISYELNDSKKDALKFFFSLASLPKPVFV